MSERNKLKTKQINFLLYVVGSLYNNHGIFLHFLLQELKAEYKNRILKRLSKLLVTKINSKAVLHSVNLGTKQNGFEQQPRLPNDVDITLIFTLGSSSKRWISGTSLVVRWLGYHASMAGGMGWILHQETRQYSQKIEGKKKMKIKVPAS